MTSAAQRLRDTVAKTVAIGAAVSTEAAAVRAEASQAAQPIPAESEATGGAPGADRA